jgi:hypothetical protein
MMLVVNSVPLTTKISHTHYTHCNNNEDCGPEAQCSVLYMNGSSTVQYLQYHNQPVFHLMNHWKPSTEKYIRQQLCFFKQINKIMNFQFPCSSQ